MAGNLRYDLSFKQTYDNLESNSFLFFFYFIYILKRSTVIDFTFNGLWKAKIREYNFQKIELTRCILF